MSGIADVVEEFIIATIVSEKVLMPRKSRMDWILTVFSVLLAGAGTFFIGLALDRYLETMYKPELAALAAGSLVLILAFLSGATGWRLHKRKKASSSVAREELGHNIRALIQDLRQELEEPVRENPMTAMVMAAMTGFIAANKRINI